jgi:hypothetical protein
VPLGPRLLGAAEMQAAVPMRRALEQWNLGDVRGCMDMATWASRRRRGPKEFAAATGEDPSDRRQSGVAGR